MQHLLYSKTETVAFVFSIVNSVSHFTLRTSLQSPSIHSFFSFPILSFPILSYPSTSSSLLLNSFELLLITTRIPVRIYMYFAFFAFGREALQPLHHGCLDPEQVLVRRGSSWMARVGLSIATWSCSFFVDVAGFAGALKKKTLLVVTCLL